MSITLSNVSNFKELEFQELTDEESQQVVGGNLFGSIVGAVAGSYVGSKAGLAGIIAGGLLGSVVGSVAEDFINDLVKDDVQIVTTTGAGTIIATRRG